MKQSKKTGFGARVRSLWLRVLTASLVVTCALSTNLGCGSDDEIPPLEMPENLSVDQRIARADQWLTQLHRDKRFNGAVLIARNHAPLLSKAYGFADPAQQIPLSPDSSFRLASVSKHFTAIAVMMLVKSGELAYDDLVTKYIPELPYPGVTIRHLLHQNSGIPDEYLNIAIKHQATTPVLTNERAVALLVQEKLPAKAAPNESFEYSNTNYIILSRLVELASGQSFEEYLQTAVFDPLNMKHTRVWNLVSKNPDFPGKVSSMTRENGQLKELKPNFVDGVSGDGAVFSSLSDFLIWDKFWYSDELLSAQEKQIAMVPATLNDGTVTKYGFGWVIDGKGIVLHNGGWLGARTVVVMDTEAKEMLVVLDNSSSEHTDAIAQNLLQSGIYSLVERSK